MEYDRLIRELKLLYPKMQVDVHVLACRQWCSENRRTFTGRTLVSWIIVEGRKEKEKEKSEWQPMKPRPNKEALRSVDLPPEEQDKLLQGLKAIKDTIKDL